MSFYRFNDVITLFTPMEDDVYERRVIPATKIQFIDSTQKKYRRATVYIPIHGRRTIKYKKPTEMNNYDKSSFTVKANQLVYLGYCADNFPPDSSLTVRKVEAHLSGSRHAQHIKLTAYNS